MAERGPSLKLILNSLTDISERPWNCENQARKSGASRLSHSAKATYWNRPPSFSDNPRKIGCLRKPIPRVTTLAAA
jgi:hypothetical protein